MTLKKSKADLATWFACAVALVPMLLWPCFARAGCCCAERDYLLGRLIASGELAAVPTTAAALGTDQTDQVLEGKFACPLCCAAAHCAVESSAAEAQREVAPSSAMAECNCQVELQSAALAPRVESSHQAGKTLPSPTSLSFSRLHKAQALTSVHEIADARIPLTSNERCALSCCWLN